MNFRVAHQEDLPQLKVVYGKIIEHMNQEKIQIWDEVYPCEFFQEDIEEKRLYILEENNEIVAAFAICNSNSGEEYVEWEDNDAEVLYIDRFGVNVKYLRQGIGSRMLSNAIALAKERGADYLRLFVVDINQPAIHLYIKNKFKRVSGVYEEKIDDEVTLYEYGFERKIVEDME